MKDRALIDLRGLDLNLLLVLHSLLQTKSVSQSALALSMSQPAVSSALARLRKATGDALMISAGRSGMLPTPYAQKIAHPLAQALTLISEGLCPSEAFNADTSRRRFTLTMLDVAEVHFMPKLLRHLATSAPQVELQTQPWKRGAADMRHSLEQGDIDVALGPFENMPQGMMQQLLFEQSFVLIAGPQAVIPTSLQAVLCSKKRVQNSCHPSESGNTQSKSSIAKQAEDTSIDRADPGSRCVVLSQAEGAYAGAQQALLGLLGPNVQYTYCGNLLAVPFVVAEVDAIAIVPEHLARIMAVSLGVSVVPLVKGSFPQLKTYCFWHPRYQQDPANQWLRMTLLQLFAAKGL